MYQHAQQFVRLVLSLRRKFPGKGYVRFGQIGAGLISLAFVAWFPGIREIIFNLILDRVEVATATDDANALASKFQIWLSATVIGTGLLILVLSFIGYSRFMMREPPGAINEGAISVNIVRGTTYAALIRSAAEHGGYTVDFGDTTESVQGLTLLEGPVVADDFQDFLEKTLNRISPPEPHRWVLDGDVYRLRSASAERA